MTACDDAVALEPTQGLLISIWDFLDQWHDVMVASDAEQRIPHFRSALSALAEKLDVNRTGSGGHQSSAGDQL